MIEIIRLVTLLVGGLGSVSAYAQAPSFSAPSLPPIPGAPAMPDSKVAGVPAALPMVSLPSAERDIPQTAPNPVLSDLPMTAGDEPAENTNGSNRFSDAAVQEERKQKELEALADLPPPVAPESSDTVGQAPAMVPAIDVAAPSSALPPPPEAMVAAPPLPLLPVPTASKDAPAAQAETHEPVRRKSWETTLKPVSTAYQGNFNYRRTLMPGVLYRTHYDYDNAHLPTRVTRADYERLLFERAAHNDVNATRALLNAGTNINATSPAGETPLMVARRHGAQQTAMLLQARGAR